MIACFSFSYCSFAQFCFEYVLYKLLSKLQVIKFTRANNFETWEGASDLLLEIRWFCIMMRKRLPFRYRLLKCKATEEHSDRKLNYLRTYQANCFTLSASKHHPFDHSLSMLAISAWFHSTDANCIIIGPRPKEKRNPSSIFIASLQRYKRILCNRTHHVEMFTCGVGRRDAVICII